MLNDTLGKRLREVRHGRGLSVSALARRLGRSEEWIRMVEAGADVTMGDAAALAAALRVQSADLMKTMRVPDEPDPERLAAALQRTCRVDRQLADDLSVTIRSLPRLMGRIAPGALRSLVDGHLLVVTQLLHEPAPSCVRRQLESAGAEAAIVAGHVYRCLGIPARTVVYWKMAARLANDAGDREAEAFAQTFTSDLYSPVYPYELPKSPARTLGLLDAAAALNPTVPPVLARTLIRQAEEMGFRRDALASGRLLDRADDLLTGVPRNDEGIYAVLWSGNLHIAFRGKIAMLAGNALEAIPLLELALTQERSDAVHNRSNMTADLSGAYAQTGDLDHAVALLDRALTTAVEAGLISCVDRICQIRDRDFRQHAVEPLVRSLDEHIRAARDGVEAFGQTGWNR